MKVIGSIFLLLLLLVGLGMAIGAKGNPWAEIEAAGYARQVAADTRAANAAQQRDQNAETFALAHAEQQATSPERVAARIQVIYWGTAALIGVMVCWAGAMAYGGSVYVIGRSRASVQAADLRSRLIPLDPVTRQYPLLIDNPHRVRYIADLNSGLVVRLDKPQSPHQLLAAGANYVRAAGVIAREAATSQDAAGVAAVNPPLIIQE